MFNVVVSKNFNLYQKHKQRLDVDQRETLDDKASWKLLAKRLHAKIEITLIASLSRHKTLLKEVNNYQKAQLKAQTSSYLPRVTKIQILGQV